MQVLQAATGGDEHQEAADRRRGRVAALVQGLVVVGVSLLMRPAAWGADLAQPGLEAEQPAAETIIASDRGADERAASPLLESLRAAPHGIYAEPAYYGEVFTNARGGIATKNATRYQALLELPLTLDFAEMGMALPGRFFLLAQNTHGRGLTRDFVGDTLVVSDIDSFDNIMQVGEYWWELGMVEDAVTVRLGKQDVNTEFIYMDLAADFIQSSFELTPSEAIPTYPNQALAAVALMQLNEALQLKAGVWDALAESGGWGWSEQDSVFVIVELEYDYALLEGAFPGTLAVSGGYLSAGEIEGIRFDAVHGYSVQLEQLVYREHMGDHSDRQGLAVFAAYYPRFLGQAYLEKAIGDHLACGVVYTGLIEQRDDDVLGAGVSWAELFQGGTNSETVYELFYKARMTSRISIQPDLQYIVSPSGIYRDAIATGVRFQLIW